MNRVLRLVIVAGMFLGFAQAQVRLTYWQYEFATRVDAMNQLIEQFNAENPDIIVVQETFPYDGYLTQVPTAVAAGAGPDVAQLFYGWVHAWSRAGYIEPLPEEYFPADEVAAYFVPMVDAVKIDGQYYGLPTAVRSLALFYNKDIFAEVGIEAPPTTWDEFVAAAQAINVSDAFGYSRIGYGFGGQDHHLLRTVLMNQLGTSPFSPDGEVLYGNGVGEQALATFTGWELNDKIGVTNFVPGTSGYRDGFITQQSIGMIIDGSFAIGAVTNGAQFEWGVAELPTFDNGVQSNFGSFFMNGITPNATKDPAKLEAAARFIKFVTSEDAMRLWLDVVGELPAARSLLDDPELANHDVYGPFLAGLAYAEATQFVDEVAQRNVFLDAINRVLLEGMSPADSIRIAAETDQGIWNQFR